MTFSTWRWETGKCKWLHQVQRDEGSFMKRRKIPKCLNTVLEQLGRSSLQTAGKEENPHREMKRSWCEEWELWGILEEGCIPYLADRRNDSSLSVGWSSLTTHLQLKLEHLISLTMLFFPKKKPSNLFSSQRKHRNFLHANLTAQFVKS